jgi:predicted N-acetyltransferase YhbS
MTLGPLEIRSFTAEDIEFGMKLASRVGWTPSRGWLTLLAQHDPYAGLIAKCDGRVIGMVLTTRYRSTAWLGYLIMSPDDGTLGLGTVLAAEAIRRLRAEGFQTVRLEATQSGFRIYRRLGFTSEFEVCRFRLAVAQGTMEGWLPVIARDDLDAVAQLDREAFGDDRERFLRLVYDHAEATFLLRGGRRLLGYVMVIPSATGVHLGPWIARDAAAAGVLLESALQASRGRTVTTRAPRQNEDACALLSAAGFELMAPNFRMRLGRAACLGDTGRVFGIASGATG